MADRVLQVEVVAADRQVWEGQATSVLARTTEGDIGVLGGHEPLLAALVPCAAEVLGIDGHRYVIALDGGFLSVADNRVSLLSQYARLADEIDFAEAEREYQQAGKELEAGIDDIEVQQRRMRALAQLKVAAKVGHQA